MEVHGSEEAEYLGLNIHTNRGLICQDVVTLRVKDLSALFMIINEKWFSIRFQPKLLSNLYETHVRSILLYGAEILISKEQKPVADVYDKLTRRFFMGLVKLKSISDGAATSGTIACT